jgi:hypothetical protein
VGPSSHTVVIDLQAGPRQGPEDVVAAAPSPAPSGRNETRASLVGRKKKLRTCHPRLQLTQQREATAKGLARGCDLCGRRGSRGDPTPRVHPQGR